MKSQGRFHFTGTFSLHHDGRAATTRRHLGSGNDPRPPNPGRPLAIGIPESSSPLVRFQPNPRPLSCRCDPHASPRFKFALHSPHTRTQGVTRPRTIKGPGKARARASEQRSERSSVPPGPAPTCRPRARGRRRQRPVLAKDEFEVELVVGATVCSSHRRGPRCCGSSSGGGGGDGSSAPLHAGPRRPGGRSSATNFPGGGPRRRTYRSELKSWPRAEPHQERPPLPVAGA